MPMNEETIERNIWALKQHGDDTRKMLRDAEARLDNMTTQMEGMEGKLAALSAQVGAALAMANGGGSTA